MKRLLALCLLLALLLCACSAAGQPTQATQQPTEETAAAPTETAAAPKTFGLSYLPEHGFNPYTCTATVNRAAFSLLYESLFVVSSHFRAEPLLCESFTASEDGKIYRYTLVSGVSFSDGTPLTAQDAAASLRAAQQSALYSGRLAHMLSVTADDDRTLTVTLDTAYENFSLMLDVPIVSAATVQSSTPLGTGPYYLDGEALRRSSRWWQTQAPAVTAETIELQAAKTPNDIRDNFEFGSTDLVYCDPNSPAAVGYRCDYEAWEAPAPILHYVGFNLYSGWFTNVALRRAFTYGVDREAMTSAVYNGFAQAATLPCSPASDLYDAQLAAQYAYSATAFQAAIHNAGVPTSETDCPVLLVCSDDPARVRAAEYLSSSMQENGFFLKVRSLGREAYVAALQAGNYDAYLGEVRLTANFDLSEFFRTGGALSYGPWRTLPWPASARRRWAIPAAMPTSARACSTPCRSAPSCSRATRSASAAARSPPSRRAWTACSTTPPRRVRWPMPTTPMTARQSRPHRRMYRPTPPNPRSRPMRRTPRRNPDRISLPLKWIPDKLRVCFGGIFITNRNLTLFKIMVFVML